MAADTPVLVLARGRERSLERRHPWIFSGAVKHLEGAVTPGATVRVCRDGGDFLAWAAYNPSARIAARVWSFDADARIDAAFFERKIEAALALRREFLPKDTSAYRIVHAESDGLPGLTVDRFGAQLVLQATSAGAAHERAAIVAGLRKLTGLDAIYERSDGDARALEGLAKASGVLAGEPPPAGFAIEEHGLRYALDLAHGQKTGFYLDQRDNRTLVRELAAGRDVLDCFCYSGGFALNAARGDARSVVALDSSEDALAIAHTNARDNALAVAFERADVFEWLRSARDARKRFDLIVLDPPKLAPTARSAERAARAYKDINLLAFKLLRPGGLLVTFSCSSGVSSELFQKIVASAASDARVDASFVRRLGPGADHPVSLAFPEGDYLKGLLCRVG